MDLLEINEIVMHLVLFLDGIDISSLCCVCNKYNIYNDDYLWKLIYIDHYGEPLCKIENWKMEFNKIGKVGIFGIFGHHNDNLPIKINMYAKQISFKSRHGLIIDPQNRVWSLGHNFFGGCA